MNASRDRPHRLLVVDDNTAIHEDVVKVLASKRGGGELAELERDLLGIEIERERAPRLTIDSAYQGREALAMFRAARAEGRPYGIALVDVRMPPGWDGVETIRRLWEEDPELHVILCSAYTDYSWSEISAALGRNDRLLILKKPFDPDELGQMVQTLCHKLDTSARETRARESAVQLLYDENPAMLFRLDAEGRIVSLNNRAEVELGGDGERFLGERFAALTDGADDAGFERRLAALLEGSRSVAQWEGRLLRPSGLPLWVRATLRPVERGDGPPAVMVGAEDVTEARSLADQLRYSERFDAVTGLPNRRHCEKELAAAIENAQPAGKSWVVCYLDLDRFRTINDLCGREGGDEFLRGIAGVIRSRLREEDALARCESDNFIAVLDDCELAEGGAVAEDLRRLVGDFEFEWQDTNYACTASIGVAPLRSPDYRAAVSAAETACRIAKERGGNRVHYSRSDDIALVRRRRSLDCLAQLNRALDDDAFELHYQPIVPLSAGAALEPHYEILLRMRDEEGRTVPPGDFLPVAEEYRLGPRIDRWVIENAFDWLRDHSAGIGDGRIAINLSGTSLTEPDFLSFVKQQIAMASVLPSQLCFEITETATIAHLFNAERFLQGLTGIGCRFALDDFGTGLCSFAYLRDLPVHYVKIDGSFVRNLPSDPVSTAMVRSINELAQILGKRTVAEFVENAEVAAALRAIGVDYAQGYGIARPAPLAQFRAVVDGHAVRDATAAGAAG